MQCQLPVIHGTDELAFTVIERPLTSNTEHLQWSGGWRLLFHYKGQTSFEFLVVSPHIKYQFNYLKLKFI